MCFLTFLFTYTGIFESYDAKFFNRQRLPDAIPGLSAPLGGVALWLAAFGMNEVNARRARLVLGWVTVFGRVYHLGM